MYLQGRASEISLRCNDTKQVRNVSASQCVLLLISLPTPGYPSFCQPGCTSSCSPGDARRCHLRQCKAWTSNAAAILYSLPFYRSLSTCIMFVSLELKSCPASVLEKIVLLIACLGGKCTTALTRHSDGDVTPHVVSNLRVCGSQSVGVRLDTNCPVRVTALRSPAQTWTAARTGKQHSQNYEGVIFLVQLNKNYNFSVKRTERNLYFHISQLLYILFIHLSLYPFITSPASCPFLLNSLPLLSSNKPASFCVIFPRSVLCLTLWHI